MQAEGREKARQALEGLGGVKEVVAERRPDLAQLLLYLVEALLRRALPAAKATVLTSQRPFSAPGVAAAPHTGCIDPSS